MAFFVDVKVVPSSGKSLCQLGKSGSLKCYLKSPPEDGKANRELIGLFAQALGIPKQDIAITLGLTSKKKRLKIDRAFTYAQILEAFGLEEQQTVYP